MRRKTSLLNLTPATLLVPALCLALGACSGGKDTTDSTDSDSDTMDTEETDDTVETDETDETDDTDDSDTDDSDTDDTDDSDTDDTDDSDTDDTDTDVPVDACNLPEGTAAAAFTELYAASGYAINFPAWSDQGQQVITDNTAYVQFQANLGASLAPVDFSTHTVVAAWMFATSTCGISVTEEAVLQHPNGGIVVDWTLYDSSGGCKAACDALGGEVKVISVSNAGSVDTCIDLDGACIP